MNLRDAVTKLKQRGDIDLPKSVVEDTIRKFLALISESLAKGETFSVRGFGRFDLYHNKKGLRTAYDFQKGEVTKVSCRPKIKFTAHFLDRLKT